jgi:hypothetical protein
MSTVNVDPVCVSPQRSISWRTVSVVTCWACGVPVVSSFAAWSGALLAVLFLGSLLGSVAAAGVGSGVSGVEGDTVAIPSGGSGAESVLLPQADKPRARGRAAPAVKIWARRRFVLTMSGVSALMAAEGMLRTGGSDAQV